MVALGIRVRVRGVGDLKRKAGQGQTGISGAGPDPQNAVIVPWPVGGRPEVRGSPGFLGPRLAQGPKSYVMALPRAVIDRLLETDVLATSEKIERAERGCRIWQVEYECLDHAPRAGHTQPI